MEGPWLTTVVMMAGAGAQSDEDPGISRDPGGVLDWDVMIRVGSSSSSLFA
jgi:hypothetical protein